MCVVSEKDLMGEGHGRGMYIVSGRKTWQRSVCGSWRGRGMYTLSMGKGPNRSVGVMEGLCASSLGGHGERVCYWWEEDLAEGWVLYVLDQ